MYMCVCMSVCVLGAGAGGTTEKRGRLKMSNLYGIFTVFKCLS